ncbi:SOS response-associated peptidase [Actinocatenispora rupis]|uniref:Abasic site processing protein n=1 Tax=Actinocatenispora rupis TaxID=519421 RepID=A0A8J3J8F9_9ACTN|nr:SOS response-associated peptidase [Actinocatenispora rupis]GID15923.1 DUF159 family protein [Actinocatenispora rupis]
MCGRYDSHRSTADLSTYLDAEDDTDGLSAGRYNTAPTQRVRIVVRADERRVLRAATWGLVPFWAKDSRIGQRMINARAETAAAKPAFRTAVRHTRALVPMDGWYEWVTTPAGRRPSYQTPRDGGVLTAAGLFSVWDRGPDGPLLTCTILTTGAVGQLRDVHERMPLLLDPADGDAWLDPGSDPTRLLGVPPGGDLVSALEIRAVAPDVGSVRNEGPHLVNPVGAAP